MVRSIGRLSGIPEPTGPPLDEAIRQKKQDGTLFVRLLLDAGIKVDIGAKDLAGHPGEKITEGRDGLRERLNDYVQMGARFAKWRAVIAIGEGRATTEDVLYVVFAQLYTHRAMLEGMILKPNMVLPGLTCSRQDTVEEVAAATVECLQHVVPASVPGIAFLSDGQSGELASWRLNAMNLPAASPKSRLPWALAFSFARAIQHPAFDIWHGQDANVATAQQALLHRAQCNRAALRGEYSAALEQT